MDEALRTSMLELPQSVAAYLDSPSLQKAVPLLIKRVSFVPDDFDWSEGHAFYRACLAARQTQIDYADALLSMWEAVWTVPDRDMWDAVEPDSGDNELTLDPGIRWDNGYFLRRFERKRDSLMLDLGVSFAQDKAMAEMWVGFNVWQGEESRLDADALNGWEYGDADCYWASAPLPMDPRIDLSPLLKHADEAWGVIRGFEMNS